MNPTENNICIINAETGMGTASPQITQFNHNLEYIKFVVPRDLSDYSMVVITSIDSMVEIVPEGEFLEKSYDASLGQTNLVWTLPNTVTCQSGCVIYQLAAYSTDESDKSVWYSKEGRLIVTDSIDTTDYSARVIGTSPNILLQVLTLVKALEISKVDKEDGKVLSSNDFTDNDKENLINLVSDNTQNKKNITDNASAISNVKKAFNDYKSEIHPGEDSYDSKSSKAQSGKAVAQAIDAIVNSAPDKLNTLSALAKALGNDPDFSVKIMDLLGTKAAKEYVENMMVQISNKFNLHSENIDRKVDKVDGMGLSKNNFSDAYKNMLLSHGELMVEHSESLNTLENKKVDKEEGKGLSSNDFTDAHVNLINTHGKDILELDENKANQQYVENMMVQISNNFDSHSENINKKVDKSSIGELQDLSTTNKENLVGAINEVNSELKEDVVYSKKIVDEICGYYTSDGPDGAVFKDIEITDHDKSIDQTIKVTTTAYTDITVGDEYETYDPGVSYVFVPANTNRIMVATFGGSVLPTICTVEYDPRPSVSGQLKSLEKNKLDKSAIITDYDAGLDLDSDERDNKVPSLGMFINYVEDDETHSIRNDSGHVVNDVMTGVDEEDEFGDVRIPTTKAVYDFVYPIPEDKVPPVLVRNTEYILDAEVAELNLTFPEAANYGDVICVSFLSGATPTNLIIDTTHTSDIDIEIEADTIYEIFAKYIGSIWLINYSEYTVSEG